MIDTSNGSLKISGELTFFPGYLFDQFKQTKFYKNQDGRRIIYLESQKLMDNKNYIVSLFFRNEKLYIVILGVVAIRNILKKKRKKENCYMMQYCVNQGLNLIRNMIGERYYQNMMPKVI